MESKIPCSVGILTLNSEKTLARCLESVKRFDDIIICDGNSTDRTKEIAKKYGARVIKQYDSDEPNLSCLTDKASRRDRNMAAAKHDWYTYVDSDDALSEELVEEIAGIVSNPNSSFAVYRMPLRICVDGKFIRYSSNYPMYQNRLFRRSTGAYFVGDVHDKIKFDTVKYPLGTLEHFYFVHWTRERSDTIWEATWRYARAQTNRYKKKSFFGYLKYGVFMQVKGIARVILYGGKNYLLHGFRETIPLKIELARIWGNVLLIAGFTKKQFGL